MRLGWARASFGLLGTLALATLLAMLTGICWPGTALARVFAVALTLPLYWALLMLLCFAARRFARMVVLMLLAAVPVTLALILCW